MALPYTLANGPGNLIDAVALMANFNALLQLAGGTLTGPLILPAGAVGAVALGVGSATDGFYKVGTNQIGFVTNGVLRFTLTTAQLTAALPIAMGSNKITGLDAGTTNGDALRYEQVIGLYLLLAGGTLSGNLAMGSNKVTGLGAATTNGDALRYEQALRLVGGTMSGDIAMGSQKVTGLGAATTNGDALRYEQALRLVGGTMSGAIAMGSSKITGLAAATVNGDAVRYDEFSALSAVVAGSNLLDNGGFEIWQRGISSSNPANTTYYADRWQVVTNEAATVTLSKETTTIDSVGLASAKIVMASTGASKYWQMTNYVERFADYRGKTVTLSARVKCSVASAFKISLSADPGATTASSYHTGGGGWETLSVSMTVHASATNFYANVGFLTAGDKKDGTYYIDSVMLAVSAVAADFVPINYQQELDRCQRFFTVVGGTNAEYLCTTHATSTTGAQAFLRFPVRMRTSPTATVNNQTHFGLRTAAGAANALTTLAVDSTTPDGCRMSCTAGTANLVAGAASTLSVDNADATIYLTADL